VPNPVAATPVLCDALASDESKDEVTGMEEWSEDGLSVRIPPERAGLLSSREAGCQQARTACHAMASGDNPSKRNDGMKVTCNNHN